MSHSLLWANTMVKAPGIHVSMVQILYVNFLQINHIFKQPFCIGLGYNFQKFIFNINMSVIYHFSTHHLCSICSTLHNHQVIIMLTSLFKYVSIKDKMSPFGLDVNNFGVFSPPEKPPVNTKYCHQASLGIILQTPVFSPPLT